MREFLFVDGPTQAVVYALKTKLSEHLYNVGSGKDISSKSFSRDYSKNCRTPRRNIWDGSKPDETPRKLMDVSK